MARSNFFDSVNDQSDEDEPQIMAIINSHPPADDSLFPILEEGAETESATDPEPATKDPVQTETFVDSTDSSESHSPLGFVYAVAAQWSPMMSEPSRERWSKPRLNAFRRMPIEWLGDNKSLMLLRTSSMIEIRLNLIETGEGSRVEASDAPSILAI